jgi:hypothetical protein
MLATAILTLLANCECDAGYYTVDGRSKPTSGRHWCAMMTMPCLFLAFLTPPVIYVTMQGKEQLTMREFMHPTTTLYETDFSAWALQQAHLLRTEELEKLDLPNLIEELEAMSVRDRRELTSRLMVLLMHLLKWRYQPTPHGRTQPRSWLNTITVQRHKIELILDDSPSLRRELEERVSYAYPRARLQASRETGLPLANFPSISPYTVVQLLDDAFLPDTV